MSFLYLTDLLCYLFYFFIFSGTEIAGRNFSMDCPNCNKRYCHPNSYNRQRNLLDFFSMTTKDFLIFVFFFVFYLNDEGTSDTNAPASNRNSLALFVDLGFAANPILKSTIVRWECFLWTASSLFYF